jgi:hypothetical protein
MADVTWTGPKGSYSLPDTPENAAKMRAAGYTTGDTMGRIRGLSGRPDSSAVPSFDDVQTGMARAAQASQMKAEPEFSPGDAPSPGKVARDILPSVAAAAGSALVPEVAGPMWLLRALAAGTASGLTDAGIQTARHLTPDGTSIGRGALDAGGEILGGLISKVLPWAGHEVMKSAMSTPESLLNKAAESRSMLAGTTVLPNEIDLAKEAIDARISPGTRPAIDLTLRPQKENGARVVFNQRRALMTERARLLDAADQSGVTFTRQDFTDGFRDLKREVSKLPRGAEKEKQLEAIMQDFLQQGRVNPKAAPNAKGNAFERMKPSQIEKMKEDWQDFAKRAYKGTADETLPILDRFTELVARNIKGKIEGLTPPTVPGSPGAIEALNRQYRHLKPLQDAMVKADRPRPSVGSLKDLNPMHLASPGARGRAALFLTDPTVNAVGRNLPRAAGTLPFTLMDLLDLAHKQEQP